MKIKYLVLFFLIVCSSLTASDRHIAILVRPDWQGEAAFAQRVKSACKTINWKADIIYIQNANQLMNKKYDFVINLIPCTYEHPKCKNYLAIFHPKHHFFTKNGFLKKPYRAYDGYLLTYSPYSYPHESKDFYDEKEFPNMLWYPTVEWREFQIVDPSYLFHICSSWSDRFEDTKFKECFSLLDNESYTRFYGRPFMQDTYPKSYHGEIPFDRDSLSIVAADAGISLVIHSSDHNKYGLPSGRIFEAAAASTVIICDQNSFVKKYFGDSVLYINTNVKNGLAIFNQIQQHMDWIKSNKVEALEKAKKAHEIFKQKFLLEDQLIRLGAFHDKI